MADGFADSDTSLRLALVLSALEAAAAAGQDPNAQDVADELQSLAAIYDSDRGPALSVYEPPAAVALGPRRRRSPSPPADWTPSAAHDASGHPLRLVLATTLASPRDSVPLHLLLSIPKGYPAAAPPLLQLQDRYLSSFAVSDALFGAVLRTFMHDPDAASAVASADGTTPGVEWTGAVCLFEAVEHVREVCAAWVADRERELVRGERARTLAAAADAEEKRDATAVAVAAAADSTPRRPRDEPERDRRAAVPVPCPRIVSSEPIIDRQSVRGFFSPQVVRYRSPEGARPRFLDRSLSVTPRGSSRSKR